MFFLSRKARLRRRLNALLRQIDERQAEMDKLQEEARRSQARLLVSLRASQQQAGLDHEVDAGIVAIRKEVDASQTEAVQQALRSLQEQAAAILEEMYTR